MNYLRVKSIVMDFNFREFKISDAEIFAAHANNPNIANKLTDQFPHPYNTENAVFFIENIVSNPHNLIRVIEIDGEACGAVGIHGQADVYRKNAEMGYWLAEQHWGKGIITKAIMEMLAICFVKTDFDRVFARPFGSNMASQRVLEKAGFILEAKLEKTFYKCDVYEDEYIYAVRRKDNM